MLNRRSTVPPEHRQPLLAIRCGITRTVLLIGPWAIKFPSLCAHDEGLAGVLWSFCRGVSANQSEVLWSSSTGVCPVRWTLAGLVNVYPRCMPVETELTEAEYDAIGFLQPTDKKPQNVGLLRGKLVWVDFDVNWNDRPPCDHIAEQRR